jgi:hypothetical protein
MFRSFVSISFLAAATATPALADNTLVHFEGGIAVIPVASVNASGFATSNVVLGVPPGRLPWVISGLTADVQAGGRVFVDGRGLLLAGGDGIGTNGGQSVEARLFCGGVAHDTRVVPLQANGDFVIDDNLSPGPPSPCNNPVLLIVNSSGAWFAAGIVKR